ncbi:nucleotide-diphospho-sugar transferase [Chytriomyces cf. hyalinus JEL632]|nr:nucleotide-diphospho-sugar transferase [Chytriomyces cf. hyalinus JEL632]
MAAALKMQQYLTALVAVAVSTVVIMCLGFQVYNSDRLLRDHSDSRAFTDPIAIHEHTSENISNSSAVLSSTDTNDTLWNSLETLEPGCRYFLNQSRKPGTLFIPPTTTAASQTTSSKFSIPQKIMFLHYNENIESPKLLCSVESAIRQNPNHAVTIYVQNPEKFNATGAKAWIEALNSNQLRIQPLDWFSAMAGTPLEPWFTSETFKKSAWVDQNLGNAFRLGMLWKTGGVYMDMDIVSVNPVGCMGRAVGWQTKKLLNNGFLSMQKRDPVLWRMMNEFVKRFRGYKWGHNGPSAVTRAIRKCPKSICKNLNLVPPERFYPFEYKDRHEDLQWTQHCDLMRSLADRSVGVHYWNKRLGKEYGELISSNSVIGVLMRAHCPVLFRVFSNADLGFSE